MKAQILDYDLFCKHVERMQAEGEKLTVRNILSQTGGTTSKVAEYLKQWHVHTTKAIESNTIAPEVLQAIMLDKQAGISKAVELYKTRVMQMESLLQQISDKCNMQELQLEAKDAEIEAINRQYMAKLATSDAQLTMLKAQVVEFKQQLKDQYDKLELAIEAKYQAEKCVAVLEATFGKQELKKSN